MPRLLQVTDKPEGGGGIRRVVDRHRTLLEDRGWQVSLIRMEPGSATPGDGVVHLGFGRRLTPDAPPLVALRRAAECADVVHLHLGFSALPAEAVEALADGAPLVANLHDVSPFDGIGMTGLGPDARPRRRDPRDWLATRRYRGRRRETWAALCRRATRMLAPSRYLADLAIAAGLSADRSLILPHALDPGGPVLRPPSACPPIVCYAGLVSVEKGAPLLLEAFGRLQAPEARLEVLGDGPSLGALRRRARELGLHGRVRFHGAVPSARVAEAFAAARAVAHPSLIPEGFGLVGIEAMQQGRPVAGFGLGGTRDWLVPEVTGILAAPPGVDSLALALDRLLGDGALADRLGAAGRALVSRRFTPDAVGRGLDALLRGAARSKPGEGAA